MMFKLLLEEKDYMDYLMYSSSSAAKPPSSNASSPSAIINVCEEKSFADFVNGKHVLPI